MILGLVCVLLLTVAWLVQTVLETKRDLAAERVRSLAAHRTVLDVLSAVQDQLSAQGDINVSHVSAVKAIHVIVKDLNAALAVQGTAILRLHTQDEQFKDVLVALNLVTGHVPVGTVN